MNLARMMEMITAQIIVRGVKHLMVSNTSVMQVNWFLVLIGKKSGHLNSYLRILYFKTKAINVHTRGLKGQFT